MCRAPLKSYKEVLKISAEIDDIDFKEICRQIQFDDDEAEMDEIEQLLDEKDQHLASFDRRYVQVLEQENNYFRNRDSAYYECVGRSQHQIAVLMDENTSLKAELSLLKEQGFVNCEMYY
jgi:hypothetical protein